jgi:hypothetical protein
MAARAMTKITATMIANGTTVNMKGNRLNAKKVPPTDTTPITGNMNANTAQPPNGTLHPAGRRGEPEE